MNRVLFVCSGNTCRSPLAEGLLRVAARRRGLTVRAASAGTFAHPGEPASLLAARVARERSVDLSGHRARRLEPEQIAAADIVVGMTEAHLDAVRYLDPANRTAVLATAWLPGNHGARGAPIPDPFGQDRVAYEDAAALLEECVAAILDHIQAGAGES